MVEGIQELAPENKLVPLTVQIDRALHTQGPVLSARNGERVHSPRVPEAGAGGWNQPME